MPVLANQTFSNGMLQRSLGHLGKLELEHEHGHDCFLVLTPRSTSVGQGALGAGEGRCTSRVCELVRPAEQMPAIRLPGGWVVNAGN